MVLALMVKEIDATCGLVGSVAPGGEGKGSCLESGKDNDTSTRILKGTLKPPAVGVFKRPFATVHRSDLTDGHDSFELEYSVHSCPPRFKDDLRLIFPELLDVVRQTSSEDTTCRHEQTSFAKGLTKGADNMKWFQSLLIIPTFQRCEKDLVSTGDEANREKDVKLENVRGRA
jgi:hypothetical protein